jgi:hypothetical protein
MMSFQTVCHVTLECRYFGINLQQYLEHLPIYVSSSYHNLMGHPKGYFACVIDVIGDQPMLFQHRI